MPSFARLIAAPVAVAVLGIVGCQQDNSDTTPPDNTVDRGAGVRGSVDTDTNRSGVRGSIDTDTNRSDVTRPGYRAPDRASGTIDGTGQTRTTVTVPADTTVDVDVDVNDAGGAGASDAGAGTGGENETSPDLVRPGTAGTRAPTQSANPDPHEGVAAPEDNNK